MRIFQCGHEISNFIHKLRKIGNQRRVKFSNSDKDKGAVTNRVSGPVWQNRQTILLHEMLLEIRDYKRYCCIIINEGMCTYKTNQGYEWVQVSLPCCQSYELERKCFPWSFALDSRLDFRGVTFRLKRTFFYEVILYR